jgi:2-keto-4-pentenoate hydratase
MALSEKIIEEKAAQLQKCSKEKITINPLSNDLKEITIEDAYKIQLAQVKNKKMNGEIVIGKKIGLTSKSMQNMLGIDEPDYGHLFDTMIINGNNKIDLESLIQPKCEPEIAFVLSKKLKGPGVTVADVLSSTRGVLPAFEIIDSRIKDWNLKIQDTIADNASSSMFVLGNNLIPLENINLQLTGLVLRKNGEIINTATSAEVMGNPAEAVAWLANKLAEFDVALKKDEIILSGSLTEAYEVNKGDNFCAKFSKMGSVNLVFD